jgi:hypothetical protein
MSEELYGVVTVAANSAALSAIARNAVGTMERLLVRQIVRKRTWFESITGKRTKSQLLVHHNREAL